MWDRLDHTLGEKTAAVVLTPVTFAVDPRSSRDTSTSVVGRRLLAVAIAAAESDQRGAVVSTTRKRALPPSMRS